MGPMTPQHPQGGYAPGRPRVTASDIRYEWEIAANVGTIAVGLLLLLLLGQFLNILVALAVPIFFTLIGLIFVNLANKGSMVQISPVQFPHLYRMSVEAAHNLDMELPAIFVKQSPIVNAYATGLFGQRTVVLHSALLEQLSNEEVKAVIAHEFGHIKLNHILYNILQQVAVSGFLGNLIFMPIRWLFFIASRAKEYSADQASL
ncbi:MAG: M48 family metallopeptidase, partial [Bacillota bacterium]